MASTNLLLAVLFALCFTVILNLSKGVQKYGIDGLSKETLKRWKEQPELKKKFYAWSIGSIGTIFASVFQILAQQNAPNSSFVVAFNGIGLMSLLIFSYFVLHEYIRIPEILGVIIIVVATIIFGLTATDKPSIEVNYGLFAIVVIIPLIIFISCGVWSIKHGFKGHAFIWGSLAGLCNGIGIALSQTAAISGDRDLFGMLLTVDIYIAILAGQGAFWFTQYGFKHGHASIVVTLYNTFGLAIPIVIDLVVLNQTLPPIQLMMLLLIGVGVVLLTAFRQEKKQ